MTKTKTFETEKRTAWNLYHGLQHIFESHPQLFEGGAGIRVESLAGITVRVSLPTS
jgi:hypothetical protein